MILNNNHHISFFFFFAKRFISFFNSSCCSNDNFSPCIMSLRNSSDVDIGMITSNGKNTFFSAEAIVSYSTQILIVRTPLVGEGTIYSNVFFVQKICIFRFFRGVIVFFRGAFFRGVFFEELSRIEVLCEQGIFCLILFTFSVIFLQIKVFFIKKFIQNYISCHKLNYL